MSVKRPTTIHFKSVISYMGTYWKNGKISLEELDAFFDEINFDINTKNADYGGANLLNITLEKNYISYRRVQVAKLLIKKGIDITNKHRGYPLIQYMRSINEHSDSYLDFELYSLLVDPTIDFEKINIYENIPIIKIIIANNYISDKIKWFKVLYDNGYSKEKLINNIKKHMTRYSDSYIIKLQLSFDNTQNAHESNEENNLSKFLDEIKDLNNETTVEEIIENHNKINDIISKNKKLIENNINRINKDNTNLNEKIKILVERRHQNEKELEINLKELKKIEKYEQQSLEKKLEKYFKNKNSFVK